MDRFLTVASATMGTETSPDYVDALERLREHAAEVADELFEAEATLPFRAYGMRQALAFLGAQVARRELLPSACRPMLASSTNFPKQNVCNWFGRPSSTRPGESR